MAYQTEVRAVGLSFRHVTEPLKAGDKVKLVPNPLNEFDPNCLEIHTLGGEFLGHVAKKDKLRTKMLAKAQKEEVTLPVLIANYYKEGDDKLWDSVEEGDLCQLWLRAYSKTPLDDDSFTEIESFTGEKVLWSEYLHICTDLKGNELMGGSTYASMGEKEFDSERIAKAWAKKNGYKTEEVLDYWNDLKLISQEYGTSVHRAMELYCKHWEKIGHEEALPRVPHLREAVKKYLRVSDFKNCVAEPLITDVEKGMSGWIDTLRFVDKKTVIIEDFKTNTFKDENAYHSKWGGKLRLYKRQFDYYGTILENHGYKVKGSVLWHWHDGKWNKHELEFNKVSEFSRTGPTKITLPANYSELEPAQKRFVREKYIELQNGNCYWCEQSLDKDPPKTITNKKIDWSKFPKGFLGHPIHLQHDHDTDKTEGAVHAYCNAVMWQYEGR